jgi:SAM-dependent methyltransferase
MTSNSNHQAPASRTTERWVREPAVLGTDSVERSLWQSYWEGLSGAQRLFREQAQEYVRSLDSAIVLDRRARVLDFGCGFGFVAEALACKVGELFIWDSSANMSRFSRHLVRGHQNIRFLDLSDAETAPCNLHFDLILVNSVVQYMTFDEFSAWLVRWPTMLAPGGRIVISDLISPAHNSISDLIDILRFSVRRGLSGNRIVWAFRKLGRYRRVRGTCPLGRIGVEELSQRGKAAGLTMTRLPANLTHFTKRFTAILTDADSD